MNARFRRVICENETTKFLFSFPTEILGFQRGFQGAGGDDLPSETAIPSAELTRGTNRLWKLVRNELLVWKKPSEARSQCSQ